VQVWPWGWKESGWIWSGEIKLMRQRLLVRVRLVCPISRRNNLWSARRPCCSAFLARLVLIGLVKDTLPLSASIPYLLNTFVFLWRHPWHLRVPLAPFGLLLNVPPCLQLVRFKERRRALTISPPFLYHLFFLLHSYPVASSSYLHAIGVFFCGQLPRFAHLCPKNCERRKSAVACYEWDAGEPGPGLRFK
jgi:hypothetical protein